MAHRSITPPQRDESQIAEEAARWFEVLKTAGPQEHAQFTAWMRQSSRHVHYFLHTTALDTLLDHVDPEREVDVQELVQNAKRNVTPIGVNAASGNDITLTKRATPAQRGRRRLMVSAAAGTAALLIGASWLAATHVWGWRDIATHVGEQRTVELPDGSIAHLNTDSRIQVRVTDDVRDIRLAEGEALFIVHKDTARPFRVYVDDSVIQAIGTQFNVYRRPHGTKVSVLEGMVRVSKGEQPSRVATALRAGEEAEVRPDGKVYRESKPDVVKTGAWRQRRLVFKDTPLSEVASEFNRYNRSPRIRLEGLDSASRHYTGTFDADDPEAFAVVLAEEKSLAVERTGSEIVIRRH